MKKKELVELIINYLSGGDAPAEIKGKYHPLDIEKYLEIVYNDIILQLTFNTI